MKSNRVTDDMIQEIILSEEYKRIGWKTTICCLTLKNGFEVIGTSACVDKENFNKELGEKYARKDAIRKVEELEGYRLQNELKLLEKRNKDINKCKGIISITKEALFNGDKEVVEALMSKLIVVKTEDNPWEDNIKYFAYSYEFDEISECEMAPEYYVIANKIDNHIIIKFQKI